MARTAQVKRETKETSIQIELNLDGSNKSSIKTGIGFFDHMLDALQKHAGFDLLVNAEGDLHIDGHHTVEDVGIVLGQAMAQAVGDAHGITRFGNGLCPLDEALSRAVVDMSGRPFLYFDCPEQLGRIGDFDGELYEEFLRAFAMNARITLHVELLHGNNQHHILESMTKSLARALKMALTIDGSAAGVPSTKGVLV